MKTSLFQILAVTLLATGAVSTSCTDEIKFGDSFLEKAPGGDTNEDTVFNSSVYTKQFLTGIYMKQYYGITYGSGSYNHVNGWTGKFDALTDCYAIYYASTVPWKNYYQGILPAEGDGLYGFTSEGMWECVRGAYKLLEHIDNVPGLTEAERGSMAAQAKCLIAARYFDSFQVFGGLPLIHGALSGTDNSYEYPRATVEETVNFMVALLDEAIAEPNLVWAYDNETLQAEAGHWTKAGAMALKARILTYAASPLFNADQPYAGGQSEAEQKHLVWYGDYDQGRWTRAKEACKAFIDKLEAEGGYQLVQATGTKPEQYRQAFRHGYFYEGSPEVIHSVRRTNKAGSNYNFYYWVRLGRSAYSCTQEYVEKFPWADGTPFNWERDSLDGKLDEMFVKGTFTTGTKELQNVTLTRDPRLYESVVVNNLPHTLDWSTGAMAGEPYELWVGGTDANQGTATETGTWATGYINMKYSFGDGSTNEQNGHGLQWVSIRLSDVYLTYAETLIQADGNLTEALKWINKVRNRVGLPNLETVDAKYLTDKDALLEELLDERVRELGFENARYFDLIRYKRADIFEKPLHGLRMYRLVLNPTTGQMERCEAKWRGASKGATATLSDGTVVRISREPKNKKDTEVVYQPTQFEYERFELQRGSRYWWTNGYAPKWYLNPFRPTEINKGYGLIQNPGWQ